MKHNTQKLIIFLCGFASQIQADTQSKSVYHFIAQSYLNAFPIGAQTAKSDTKNPLAELLESTLSAREMRECTLKLFAAADDKHKKDMLITKNHLWDDIDLFCGRSKKEQSVLKSINYTETVAGEIALAGLLAQPLSNSQILVKRQEIIRELARNSDLFEKINATLSQFKTIEPDFLVQFKEQTDKTKKLCKTEYPTEALLEDWAQDAPYMQTKILVDQFVKTYVGIGAISQIALAKWLWNQAHTINSIQPGHNSVGPMIAYSIYFTLIGSTTLGATIYEEKNRHQIRMYFQKTLITLRKYKETIEQIAKIVKNNPILKNNLENTSHITNFAYEHDKLSEKLAELLKLLNKDTFKGETPSLFSSPGNILAAKRIFDSIQDQFIASYKTLGEIDAYLSLAKLYNKHNGSKAPYCFAEYENAYKPHIQLENFWHPMIAPEFVVLNSLELGGIGQSKDIVLTGPNAGGKSTVLKSLIINALFAQTIGIVPAKTCRLTPFKEIKSYLNITDDLAAGNSLFKTEVLRARDLIFNLKHLKPEEFALVVADELFSGTAPTEGAAAAYAIARYLSSISKSISVIATHFPLLTQLEKDTNKIFKNMRVTVKKNADGTLTYPYKLEDGKAYQNVALDILRLEGFASDMLNDAYKIVDEYTKGTAAIAA